jgi:hypothetical protein
MKYLLFCCHEEKTRLNHENHYAPEGRAADWSRDRTHNRGGLRALLVLGR